jgi:peptidoglycan hydrolase-like protein with peptidoglycan-binding domain
MPNRDLSAGNTGEAVVWLQKFLIAKSAGPAAASLALAGATGYFGSITQRALAEYQAAQGILPSAGYFGPLTRSHIQTQG